MQRTAEAQPSMAGPPFVRETCDKDDLIKAGDK
jgi:hypothetical protein